jgi:hypothetical protein
MDMTRDGFAELAPEDKALVNDACDAFEAALQSGEAPAIERHLGGRSGVVRDVLLRELLFLAIEAELRRHGAVDLDALTRALPEARPLADEVLEEARRCAELSQPLEPERNGAAWPKPLGRFLLKKELGSGAFGTVFLADDPELGREVALKVPHPTTLFSQELRRRFLREGEVAMRLDHPNLVRVLEVGEIGMVSYIASAYEEGVALARWLEQRGGRAPAREAAELTEKLARAVHHAHERGVLHCDLKPGNVLLASGGLTPPEGADSVDLRPPLAEAVPKIADFGLAKLVGDRSDLSQTGQILGSPSYMAPEQAAGRRSEITARTDVYGLGAILYELLTGRPPFAEKSLIETLARVLGEEPARPRSLAPGVPADLEAVCLQCLEKDPRRRYASAAELADDLGRWRRGETVRARRVGAAERCWRWARWRPVVAGLLALLALAVTAGLSTSVVLWRRAVQGEAEALENLSQAEAALGEVEDQVAMLRRLLTNNVNLSNAFGAIGRHGVRPFVRLADSEAPLCQLVRTEMLADSEATLSELVQKRPTDWTLRVLLAKLLVNKYKPPAEGNALLILERAAKLVDGMPPEVRRDPAAVNVAVQVHTAFSGAYEHRRLNDLALAAMETAYGLKKEMVLQGAEPAKESLFYSALGLGLLMLRCGFSEDDIVRRLKDIRDRPDLVGGAETAELLLDLLRAARATDEAEGLFRANQKAASLAAARKRSRSFARISRGRKTRAGTIHSAWPMNSWGPLPF